MARADPYIIPVPKWVLEMGDREVLDWFNFDNRWKHDIWQKLGGGGDSITDLDEIVEVNQEMITTLLARVSEVEKDPLYRSISSDYTTAGSQFLRVTATATITAETNPADGTEVFIQPTVSVPVTFSGQVNGGSSITMYHAYDTMHLKFIAEAGEWVIQ